MYKKNFFFVFFVAIGLTASGSAIFADTLGLDQNADWGKARIGILFVGVLIILFAALYYLYADYINSAVYKAKTVFVNFPPQIFTVVTIVIVIIIYIWFATSGRWTTWKSRTYYYDGLARGFRSGHLYLPIEPDPKLLELPNPYDPAERKQVSMKGTTDISLYKGKFYLYWGPVPALILAAIYQVPHQKVGDLIMTFSFVCGMFLTQTVLAHFLWKQYFANLPQWTLHLSTLAIGLVGPLVLLRHISGSARIYEAAISGAQFFFMAGVLAAVPLVTKHSISNWRLVLAGVLWALAIGTRLTAAVPVGFMALLIAFWIFKMDMPFSKKMVSLIFLGAPLFFGFLCLGWYNWARFDSVTENGFYYALSNSNLQIKVDKLFSPLYFFQNIYNYILNPPYYKPDLPFVFIRQGSEIPVFSFYSVPPAYATENMAGLLYIFPLIIFSVIPLLLFIFNRFQGAIDTHKKNQIMIITLGLGGSFLMPFAMLMTFFWAGMRYTGDFLPSLMMLSVIGFWQGYEFLQHKPAGKFYTVLAVALVGLSILIGMLLIISTDTGFIKKLI